MDNLIRAYDNVVSADFCDGLIKKFEDNPQYQEKLSKGLMSLTHMELMRPDTDLFNEDIMHLVDKFQKCIKEYKTECKIEMLKECLHFQGEAMGIIVHCLLPGPFPSCAKNRHLA